MYIYIFTYKTCYICICIRQILGLRMKKPSDARPAGKLTCEGPDLGAVGLKGLGLRV